MNINMNTMAYLNRDYEKYVAEQENRKYFYGRFVNITNIFHGGYAQFLEYFIFVLCFFLFFGGDITKGEAAATILYVGNFVFPLRYIVQVLNEIK